MQDISFEIDVHALAAMRAAGDIHTLLDIREPDEVAICSLDDSVLIPMQLIPQQLETLPREHPLIVMCHSGGRSAMITDFLRNSGFDNARNLTGGIDAWAALVAPDMARY